jgi:replicative DNA helicase
MLMKMVFVWGGAKMRQPPYDVSSEQCVIGSMLLDNQVIDLIDGIISFEDFYLEAHKRIFKAIIENYKTTPIDFITLSNLFTEQELKNIGGSLYITDMVDNIPSAANIVFYANIVKEHSIRRKLLESVYEITELAYGAEPLNEVIEKSQKAILAINPMTSRDVIKSAKEVAKKTLEQIEMRHEKGGLTGISTGIKDLDTLTAGLHGSELIIIAGRPGMGKTAFALNIANEAALRGEASLVFSVEMPDEMLMIRILASMSKIESSQIRKGYMKETDWPKLVNSVAEISKTPLYFDDSPLITPAEIRMRARKAQKENDIKLIVVDYIQLITPAERSANREREIAEISRTLKSIARELKIPVIAVSQLNRGVDSRPNKRPLMSDLRESGAIEQDADVIMFIYRDEVYNKDEDNPEKGIAEIDISKQRNGPPGLVKTVFSGKYQKFSDLNHIENTSIPHRTTRGFGYE